MSERAAIPDWLQGSVRLVALPQQQDQRGVLTPIEFDVLPFAPQRVFFVAGSDAGVVRGMHGHRTGVRLLLCIAGGVDVEMRIGERTHAVTLRSDGIGLLVHAGVWMQETYASGESVLAVITDLRFDEELYFHEP